VPGVTGWKRTHCIRGHEYTPEDTQVDPRGKRYCRACKHAYRLRNVERDRAAARARGTTPEARARRNARLRERYGSGPEYRAREKARSLANARAPSTAFPGEGVTAQPDRGAG
jgi:hypothetical protein